MCTVLLSPGVNPIAVNKYIISYHNLRINIKPRIFLWASNILQKGRVGPLDLYLCLYFCLKVFLHLEPTAMTAPHFISHHNKKSQALPLGCAIVVAAATRCGHVGSMFKRPRMGKYLVCFYRL